MKDVTLKDVMKYKADAEGEIATALIVFFNKTGIRLFDVPTILFKHDTKSDEMDVDVNIKVSNPFNDISLETFNTKEK
jgi:hypothetical protein